MGLIYILHICGWREKGTQVRLEPLIPDVNSPSTSNALGTPCFSLKGNNDWWERQTDDRSHSPVNPMRFRDGTPCFSLKGENSGTWPEGELVRQGRWSGRPWGVL